MGLPKWTGFQGKTLWDWLDLLLVPVMLAVGIFVLETTESRRQEYNLTEQYKQQILRDYFNELSALVFEQQKLETLTKAKEYAPERELLGSRTLATLEILGEDASRKSQIIRFIGNSSLSRFIPIRRANLATLDLSYVDLTGADLRRTNLTGAILCGANLREANFEGAILSKAQYNDETVMPDGLSQLQLQSMDKRDINSCGLP